MELDRSERIAGALLGAAVGDALGLPTEGLSPRRAGRMFAPGALRHRLVLGRGLVSDDTEHACMVGQALLAHPMDAAQFARSLAWRLRLWLLGMPAGVGLATARAILKLWAGFPVGQSGVRSAGNGPAMRAPLLGACLIQDEQRLVEYVRLSTRLTHTDPRAEQGALAIALATAYAARTSPQSTDYHEVLEHLRSFITHAELLQGLADVEQCLQNDASAAALAGRLHLVRGVTGYICHTVPVALFCWLRFVGDYRRSIEEVVALGGDTDTTAAIVGGLAGASAGVSAIPDDWLQGLAEWPRSVDWMRRLAARLAEQFPADGAGHSAGPLPLFWPAVPARNVLFLAIVLAHGFRRLLPPY